MFEYVVEGEGYKEAKVKKIGRGKGYGVITINSDWADEDVLVIRRGKVKKMEEIEVKRKK